MGRDATGREVSYIDAGVEVFYMEASQGLDTEGAVRAAIEAAVATAHRGFTRGTRDDILEKAEDLDATENPGDDSIVFDGAAALMWYAHLLDETLPPEQQLGGI